MAKGSYWQRASGRRARWGVEELPGRVDFAVVGGGISGVCTALRLRERCPGADILLIERRHIGFGASGRNAGLLSPVAAPLWLLGAHRRSEWAWGVLHLNQAMHEAARWLGDAAPSAELEPCTLRIASAHRLVDAGLDEFAEALADAGVHATLTTSPTGFAGERPPLSASPAGPAGAQLPGPAASARLALRTASFTVNPFALVEALAGRAHALGIAIDEGTEVLALEPSPAGGALRLRRAANPGGQARLVARRVVVCTNAAPAALGLRERLPAASSHSFMVASGGPVTRAQQAGEFTVEVGPTELYYRVHRGRALLGGLDAWRRPAQEFGVPSSIANRLSRFVAERFAVRDGVAEAWSGRLHVTPTGLPILRPSRRHPAIVYNVGYGGTGMTLAMACAPLVAAMASGEAYARADDERLAALLESTRVPVVDSARAIGRIAWRAAWPWRASPRDR